MNNLFKKISRISFLLMVMALLLPSLISALFLFDSPVQAAQTAAPRFSLNADLDLRQNQVEFVQVGGGSLPAATITRNGNSYEFAQTLSDNLTWFAKITVDGETAISSEIFIRNLQSRADFGVIDVSNLVGDGVEVTDIPGSITGTLESPPATSTASQSTDVFLNKVRVNVNDYSIGERNPGGTVPFTISNVAPGTYELTIVWKVDTEEEAGKNFTYRSKDIVVSNNNQTNVGNISAVQSDDSIDDIVADGEPQAQVDDSCEGSGGAFAFVVCPLLTQSNAAFSRLDDEIIDALDFEEAFYNDPNVRESWARIRNIAYILLIPIMLVMVISTALGFSFVDAYTVKRALPRMFAAIIFMALSFDICIILIEIVNGVGQGVAGLIAAPFGGLNELTLQDIFTPNEVGGGVGLGVLAGIGAFAALGPPLIGILLSYLGVMVLALLLVFVLLAFRELLLVFLLIMGPIAILSWIFPGNDKLWKLWYNSFTKLLYLFPIIMALLATGRAFASVVQNNEAADGFVVTIVKITAFVGPYFFIPKAFVLAGGAFANIAGMANDRGKGVFDRQRKKRGQKAAQGLQTTKDGARTGVGSRFSNRVGMGVASGAKGRYGFGKKGQNAMARVADEATARNAKENGRLQQLALHNDDGSAVMALSGGTQAGAKAAADDLVNQWKKDEAKKAAADPTYRAKADRVLEEKGENALKAAQSVGINKRNSQAGFQLMMQNKARAINAGDTENLVERGLDRLHGTNGVARAEASGEAQYFARSATRNDLGGADGINKAGLYGIANGETKTITAMGDRAMVSARAGTMDQSAAIHYRELESMKTNATGLNRDVIVSQMAELEDLGMKSYMSRSSGVIDPGTGVQKQIESVERFDGARALADPDYARAHATWSPAERAAGQRRVSRDQNMSDVASISARKYEQVDPNHL